jgi:hypothetical protein
MSLRFAFCLLVALVAGVPFGRIVRADEPAATSPTEKIKNALQSPTQMEFVETPLCDVIDYLKDHHKIEIQLDTRALNEMGISSDTQVTKNLKGISLRSALRLLTADLGLTYVIRDEVLLITSAEQAAQTLCKRVYDVADLVPVEERKEGGAFDALANMVAKAGKIDTASKESGAAWIASFRTAETAVIVVCQTEELQEEIATLLGEVRESKHPQ